VRRPPLNANPLGNIPDPDDHNRDPRRDQAHRCQFGWCAARYWEVRGTYRDSSHGLARNPLAKLGEAVREAGFTPNTLTPRIDEAVLLRRYALLARELGRFPTKADLKLMKRRDPKIPV